MKLSLTRREVLTLANTMLRDAYARGKNRRKMSKGSEVLYAKLEKALLIVTKEM